MARHNVIGRMGEKLAVKWLSDRDFEIVERNYREKWGEIDIVARETETVHFIEVKTVSYETRERLAQSLSTEGWRPEENVHRSKQERLARAIATWLESHNYKGRWQIDILALRVVPREKYASIRYMENVILE